MAVWGLSMADAYALTDRQAIVLWDAYLRRKQFEAKLLIAQVSEAMQKKSRTANLASLAQFGFGIEGLS